MRSTASSTSPLAPGSVTKAHKNPPDAEYITNPQLQDYRIDLITYKATGANCARDTYRAWHQQTEIRRWQPVWGLKYHYLRTIHPILLRQAQDDLRSLLAVAETKFGIKHNTLLFAQLLVPLEHCHVGKPPEPNDDDEDEPTEDESGGGATAAAAAAAASTTAASAASDDDEDDEDDDDDDDDDDDEDADSNTPTATPKKATAAS